MNGIYYGTSREISITQASGKPLKINANNLSKNKFAELVTYLGQTRFTKSHDMEATAEYFKTGHEFIIPNDRIIKANKNRMMVRCGFTVAFFVIFLGMSGYYFVTNEDSAGFFHSLYLCGYRRSGASFYRSDTIDYCIQEDLRSSGPHLCWTSILLPLVIRRSVPAAFSIY